jgi:DNA polymerase-3 subunit epsilon
LCEELSAVESLLEKQRKLPELRTLHTIFGTPLVGDQTEFFNGRTMDFAADFTAIDFETASRRSDSACQLAAVRVREGRIVDQACWLIRPEPFYFSQFNIQIHGITPDDVRDAPNFDDLWPEIRERFGDDCLVAHNASFDIGVLLACLRAHRHEIPELQFTCTRAIARKTWPHRRRYGLKPLAEWLGIRFKHHDALEDSIACAKILLAAGIDRDAESLEDLERRLRLGRGEAGDWGHRSPSAKSRRQKGPTKRRSATTRLAESPPPSEPLFDLQRAMIRADFIQALSGKSVVVSGRFRLLSCEEAQTLAGRLGGKCCEKVDQSIDLLVAGGSNAEADREIVSRLQQQGHKIEIVDEQGFLDLVGG